MPRTTQRNPDHFRIAALNALKGLSLPIAAVSTSTLARFAITGFLGSQDPYITFYPAVMFASWYGGLVPGIVTACASVLVALYLFIPPAFDIRPANLPDALNAVLFLAVSVFISLLTQKLRSRNTQLVVLNKKIEQQREELRNFSDVLVHDLRTPVRSIRLMSELVENSIQKGNGEESGEYCRMITQAGGRLSDLIDTLYQYTKTDEVIVFESVDMNQLLRETLINLEPVIQDRHVQITHAELPTVYGNAPQLIQLLQNLIANGIKYCEAEIPTVHISAIPQTQSAYIFAVQDNGIGISEKYHRQIFEPFKRVCRESKYEGTGLGLSTCKKIVERHHGRIWCESKEKQGATFLFTLRTCAPSQA
jgi:signal transduction histidine kinase